MSWFSTQPKTYQPMTSGYSREMHREDEGDHSPDPLIAMAQAHQDSSDVYNTHGAGHFDHTHHELTSWATFGMVRAESMDLVNDPRFFTHNVLEKRLAAFAALSAIGAFLLTNSLKQMYALKKDMQFGWNREGIHAVLQFATFLLMMFVSYSMAVSAFIKTHQIFFCYRLMTAGPMGIEQAILFYLNRTITMWRHFAIKMIMNGMIFYFVGSGSVLCMKFIGDAQAKDKSMGIGQLVLAAEVQADMVLNKKAIAEQLDLHPKGPPLDMHVHTAMAVAIFLIFAAFGCHLRLIRKQHTVCFQAHYHMAHEIQHHLLSPSRTMGLRAGAFIET